VICARDVATFKEPGWFLDIDLIFCYTEFKLSWQNNVEITKLKKKKSTALF